LHKILLEMLGWLRAPIWRWAVACLAWTLAGAGAAAAPPAALVTILDGQAELLIGARSVVAVEGQHLGEGTLVDTSPRTTLMRLEWPDGSVLDLGADTHVMLQPGALGRKGEAAPAFYLLQGWAKFRSATAQGHAGFTTQVLDVLPGKGSLVAFVEPARTWLFVESGDARLAERNGKGRHNLAGGGSFFQAAQGAPELAPRPQPELMKMVPRGFRDTIAPRADRFKGQPEPTAVALQAPVYAALQGWLQAEPVVRRDFPKRFAPLLHEPSFRAAVEAHMRSHPEWEPVLHPPLPRTVVTPYGERR
jgi:hypothetical protein